MNWISSIYHTFETHRITIIPWLQFFHIYLFFLTWVLSYGKSNWNIRFLVLALKNHNDSKTQKILNLKLWACLIQFSSECLKYTNGIIIEKTTNCCINHNWSRIYVLWEATKETLYLLKEVLKRTFFWNIKCAYYNVWQPVWKKISGESNLPLIHKEYRHTSSFCARNMCAGSGEREVSLKGVFFKKMFSSLIILQSSSIEQF